MLTKENSTSQIRIFFVILCAMYWQLCELKCYHIFSSPINDDQTAAPKEIAAPEGGIVIDSYKPDTDVEGKMVAPETSPVVPNNELMAAESPQVPDLMVRVFIYRSE